MIGVRTLDEYIEFFEAVLQIQVIQKDSNGEESPVGFFMEAVKHAPPQAANFSIGKPLRWRMHGWSN